MGAKPEKVILGICEKDYKGYCIMTNFFKKIESALAPYAENFTPEGTDARAVIHQWVHAIAYDTDHFGKSNGAEKQKIIELLSSIKIYQTQEKFKNKLRKFVNLNPNEESRFTFIDLFAGVGGTRQGMEKAGGLCVFSSEFDKHAQVTYEQNYGEFPFGDITKIANRDLKKNWVHSIPDHDVLVGGFPCQPFSHAGLKKGIDDTRGTLFDNIAQILEAKKPTFALLENVRGLISHDKGHTLKTVLRKLVKMGYQCLIPKEVIFGDDAELLKQEAKKMVLRSRDFGVPQNRQRIYIVLWREDKKYIEFTYPIPPMIPTQVKDILESNPDPKYTISARLWAGHKRRKIENRKKGKGFGYGLVTPESEYTNTISARYYKDGSECLIEQENGENPRKITPREASRLQGFNENFIINPSDVQAYKQFGNSVSVPVIEALGLSIRKFMEN